MSAKQLSKLYIKSRHNELPLPLHSDLDDIPIFWQLIKTPYSHKISLNQSLLYSTLLPWIKDLGAIMGFQQVAHPYSLRYGAGKAFDENNEFYYVELVLLRPF